MIGCSIVALSYDSDKSQNYSMWTGHIETYKHHVDVYERSSLVLTDVLIPGPKSPAKDIDVYLQPLIKELQELWKGVWTKDAATGTYFEMKAALLWTINDFPARSSLSGWSGQGYYACPTCNEDTPSMAVKNKIAYVGHRRFLKTNHPLRNKKKEFYGLKEPKPKPRKFSELDIQLQINKVLKRRPGKHPDITKKNPKPIREIELNWSKRSIFWDLEYWPFLLLKHNLDVMHIEKNALEALLNTLLQNDKTKDTPKARQDLEKLNVRKELWLAKKPNGKFEKPHPKYSFTTENRKRFCKFIKGVRLPDGFGSNFKQKVTADDNNITGMKSHDCHIMMHRLLPYGVQQYLPKSIAAPIIELCLFFKQLCARTLMQQDMGKAKKQSISIMIELEKIFPPAFFDIMIHVAIHLPDEAILGGPLRYRWMFPFERYMKKLKNYVRNKAKPEGSIAEGYVSEEALTFCSRYLKDDVETRFNRLGRNDDGLPEEGPDTFQVFRSVCKLTGRMKATRLTADVRQAVLWFVLNNSPEIDADILAFREESPDNVGTGFPAWFNHKIREKKVAGDCSEDLFSLACGPISACTYPACIVNGVKFVVHERDILHTTQCSGVSTLGLDGEMYYGQLEEILELTYIGHRKVVFDRSGHAPRVYNDDNANANEDNEDDVAAHVLDDDDVVVSDDDEVNPSTNVGVVVSSDDSDDGSIDLKLMACVGPSYHGGDAGGDPPNRPVPTQCQSSQTPPPQRVLSPESYFILAHWYANQEKVVVGDNVYTVGDRVKLGLELKLRVLWRKAKNRIKANHFTRYHSQKRWQRINLPPPSVWEADKRSGTLQMKAMQDQGIASSSNDPAQRSFYNLVMNPHMTDSRTLDELARDNSLANNDEGASGRREEEEEGNEGTNDGDYSEENEEEGRGGGEGGKKKVRMVLRNDLSLCNKF
ncbi:hypothetical protein Tco_1145486 [Tanacetum coccineum]